MMKVLIDKTVDLCKYGSDIEALKRALKDNIAMDTIFVVSEQIDFTESFSFAKNVTLRFTPGGVLKICAGCKVIIEGPIEAGLWQICDGEGVVELNQAEAVYPQWWGAVGDGIHDDAWAIQKAIDTCTPTIITRGTFYVGATLKAASLHLRGINKHESILKTDKSMAMINLGDCSAAVIDSLTLLNTTSYEQMKATGKSANTHNIIRDVAQTGANHVSITNCIVDGGYSGLRPNSSSRHWSIDQCEFRNQKFVGIMNGASHVTITNSTFHHIGEDTDDKTFMPDGHAHHTHPIYINALNDETIKNFTITNNVFEDNASDAIHIITGSQNAVIENIVIANNSFARNSAYRQFGHTGTRLRPDIIIGTTSSANEHSMLSKVIISNNVFAEPARIPPTQMPTANGPTVHITENWELRAAIQAVGNCREVTISGNVAHGYNQFVHLHDGMAAGNHNYGMSSVLIANNVVNLNHMFSIKENELDEGFVPPSLHKQFRDYGEELAESAAIRKVPQVPEAWDIVDQGRRYLIRKEHGKFEAYQDTVVHRATGAAIYYLCHKANGVEISHNDFSNAAGNGIVLYGANQEPCKIHGNTLLHCGRSDIDGAYASIYFKEAISAIEVSDNLIIAGPDAAKSGIRIDSGCTHNMIRDNTIRNVTHSGIWLYKGSKHNVLLHNYLFGDALAVLDQGEDNQVDKSLV